MQAVTVPRISLCTVTRLSRYGTNIALDSWHMAHFWEEAAATLREYLIFMCCRRCVCGCRCILFTVAPSLCATAANGIRALFSSNVFLRYLSTHPAMNRSLKQVKPLPQDRDKQTSGERASEGGLERRGSVGSGRRSSDSSVASLDQLRTQASARPS